MKKKSMIGMVLGMILGLLVVPFAALYIVNSENDSKIESVEHWGDNYLESIGFAVSSGV